MIKWEYKTLKFETESSGYFSDGKLDEVDLDKKLNLLGEEGWELISSFDTNKCQGETKDIIAMFKRQKNS